MTAYAEQLCEHCGIVRVGAAGPFPADYRYSVTYIDRGEYAEPIGFDAPKIRREDFDAIVRTINEATGKLVAYDRAPNSRVIQINPTLTQGKIVMTKHAHHVDEAKTADGSIDQTVAVQHTLEACVAILGGKLKLVHMEQQPSTSHPGRIRFTFDADVI